MNNKNLILYSFFKPHNWKSIQDTKFSLGRYQKVVDETMSTDDDEDEREVEPTKSALDPKHLIGRVF